MADITNFKINNVTLNILHLKAMLANSVDRSQPTVNKLRKAVTYFNVKKSNLMPGPMQWALLENAN